MKASYSYTVLNTIPEGQHKGGFYPTDVIVIAENEPEARDRAIELLGNGTLVKKEELKTELKLTHVVDIEVSKQRFEQSLKREPPSWMEEEKN